MSVSFCLPHPVAVSAFMVCRGLCACTEMLWMCVLYVSFGSKVRPRTSSSGRFHHEQAGVIGGSIRS